MQRKRELKRFTTLKPNVIMDELKKYIEMLIKQQSAKDADFKALIIQAQQVSG